MKKNKLSLLMAMLLVLAMCVWTLSACGESGGDAEAPAEEPEATEEAADDGYLNPEVKSDLSMADEVKAFYDKVDMDYAYELAYELAYDWDNLAEANGWRAAGSDAEHAAADYLLN